METEESERGLIIELKYAEDGNLEKSCQEALEQIESRRYEEVLLEEGIEPEHIIKYGIAFYKKICLVKKKDTCLTKNSNFENNV